MLDTNKYCKPQQLVQQFTLKTPTPTNANGLASIEIGGGTLQSGNFTTINWANGPYL
jgi:hypothetical protein